MGPFARLGLTARRGFGRIVPEPFAIAVGLTVVVMAAAVAVGHGPIETIRSWNRPAGLWNLLTFAMQMSLMLVLGSALAAAPPVRRALSRLVDLAGSPRQLVALTAGVAIGLALLNWSLGLIGGALVAREGGRRARERGWALHYPLLCAAGYSGLMVWHGGLSGSAPLKATTTKDLTDVLGPELAARVGEIPLSESLFGTLNLWVSGGLLVLGPLLFWAMTPRAGEDPSPEPPPPEEPAPGPAMEAPPADVLEAIERSPVVIWALALPMAGALGLHIAEKGLARLDFNTVNLVLWCLALLLHGRPDRFLAACEEGVKSCTGVILQFPLYAGIMGIMSGSGLSTMLSEWIASAGAELMPIVTFVSAGVVNLFVPSGGGQWAVQGPILAEAALSLGLDVSDAMMAMAYGDQWTNMLQPFWALPLLAITGARARDIIGYCAVWMAAGGAWVILNLLLHV